MYDELAVPSMLHAVDIFNHLPEAGGLSPVEKRGQKKRLIEAEDHIFGSRVKFYVAKRKEKGKNRHAFKTGSVLGQCKIDCWWLLNCRN